MGGIKNEILLIRVDTLLCNSTYLFAIWYYSAEWRPHRQHSLFIRSQLPLWRACRHCFITKIELPSARGLSLFLFFPLPWFLQFDIYCFSFSSWRFYKTFLKVIYKKLRRLRRDCLSISGWCRWWWWCYISLMKQSREILGEKVSIWYAGDAASFISGHFQDSLITLLDL